MEVTANVQVPFKTKGHYKVETRNSTTGKRVESKCFDVDNVVTTEGDHYFFNLKSISGDGGSLWGNLNIGFGSGTTEITKTDIALGGTVISRGSSVNETPPVEVTDQIRTATSTVKRSAVYPPGTATGTWGQVGCLNGSTLLAGQVLRDGGGTPTTVTFLGIEEVTVTYSIEITYVYAVMGQTVADMPTFTAPSVLVDGVTHSVTILSLPYWVASSSNNTVISDPSQDLKTIFNSASHLTKGIHLLNATTNSAVESDWNYSSLNDTGSPVYETLIKGSRYKVITTFSVPYTSIQDKYIKEILALGYQKTPTNIGNSLYNFGGGFQLDPPIYKGAGFELNVTFHLIYELV